MSGNRGPGRLAAWRPRAGGSWGTGRAWGTGGAWGARGWPGATTALIPLTSGAGVGVVLALGGLRLPGWLGPAALVGVPVLLLSLAFGLRDQRGGIALFAVGLPAGLTTLVGGAGGQVLAAAAVVLVASGRMLRGRSPLLMPPAVLALLALVGWSVAMSPVAVDLARAARWNAALLTAALLAAAVVTAAGGSLARLRHLALVLFAGSVVTCSLALAESTQRRSFGAAVVTGRAQGVFSPDPRVKLVE